MLRYSLIHVLALWGIFASVSGAAAADETSTAQPPREGRVTNLDSQPFRFRLARKTGVAWTDEITLPPGEVFLIRAGESDDVKALEGITGDGRGSVTIEFPELGGRIRLKLPAGEPDRNIYIPNWFHVRDSNGFSRMVQAKTKEDAEARHKILLAEPPLTEAELTSVKRMLRANWVLYDK